MAKQQLKPAAVERPRLFHYSRNIVKAVTSSDPSKRGAGCYKPSGFWVSVDDPDEDGECPGWPGWCVAEGWGIDGLANRHEITLATPERLLWITTESDLDWFDETFGWDETPFNSNRESINWGLVAAQFAGVVIAPYQYSRRFTFNWYYGWDCASGVIWDASVIAEIAVIEPLVLPER